MFNSLDELSVRLTATGYFIDPVMSTGRLSGGEVAEAAAA